jgi:hypothetical protein
MAAFLLQMRAGFLAGAALLSTAGRGWMLGHDKRQRRCRKCLWRLSGGRLNERPSALRHCPRTGRAQQLVIVRNAHEETLREHGHDPAVDPGKTYVDLIMKGIELLLAELSNTGQKN